MISVVFQKHKVDCAEGSDHVFSAFHFEKYLHNFEFTIEYCGLHMFLE